MEQPAWQKNVRAWWGPVVTYLLAAILNLSQKQSAIGVYMLLAICSVWTWLVLIGIDFVQNLTRSKQLLFKVGTAVAVLCLAVLSARFFTPGIPPRFPTVEEIATAVRQAQPPEARTPPVSSTEGTATKPSAAAKPEKSPSQVGQQGRLTPLVKDDALSVLVPFDRHSSNPRILTNDFRLDPNSYRFLNDLSVLDSPRSSEPVTALQAREIVGTLLRYYVLKSIGELQAGRTVYSATKQRGRPAEIDAHTLPPTPVPDAEHYPTAHLNEIIIASIDRYSGPSTGTRQTIGQHRVEREWSQFWNSMPLETPAGSVITINAVPTQDGSSKFTLVVERSRGPKKFQLSFTITSSVIGKGVLPKHFNSLFEIADMNNVEVYSFLVKEHFEWYGEYSSSEPYMRWVESLLAGLRRRFVIA